MSTALSAVRPFSAIVRYPGKQAFRVGTFYAKRGDTEHDKDIMVLDEIKRMWGAIMPDGLAAPAIEKTEWGSILFVSEDEL